MHWKIKGIAAMLSYRLLMKNGLIKNLNTSVEDFEKAFKHTFLTTLVPMLLESHMNLLFKKKTHFVAAQALTYSLKFLTQGVKLPLTMSLMQPYLENLLFETAVPIILVTTHDIYIFKDDPVEYIRKQEDSDSMFSVRRCMIELLRAVVSYKAAKTDPAPVYLHKFLEFCVQNLN